MGEIIPAILEHDLASLGAKLSAVEGLVDWVQIDLMDGVFVKNTTVLDGAAIAALPARVNIECHLMVEHPLEVARTWVADPRVQRLIFHYETLPEDVLGSLEEARRFGVEVAIAINPETDVAVLQPFIDHVDMVLVMGVHPGYSGQTLDPNATTRVEAVRKLDLHVPIEVDGGVNADTITELAEAGATRFVTASAIFSQTDLEAAISDLEQRSNI